MRGDKGEAEERRALERLIELAIEMLEEALKTPAPSETHEKIARERLAALKRAKEVRDKERLTPEDVEAAMKIVCWEDLAGCCAPKKNCMFFLAACEALRLDPEEVHRVKSAAVRNLLRAKGRLPLHH